MKHGACLSDETLTDYLEGSLDPIVQVACEGHLIACDTCRGRLALFMRALQPAVTAEEEAAVESIAQSWNARHSRVVPIDKGWHRKRIVWYAVAASVLLLLVLGPGRMAVRWMNSTQPARELVQAMLEKDRPFEAQLAFERHLPRVRSAADEPGLDFDALSAEMSRRAASQYDLGRFKLIQKQFSEAITLLQEAARDPKAPAAVHNDLGVAYMEQALAENRPKAKEEFDRALELDPKFAPAVFNLSLFYDSEAMPDEANRQRILYLQLDSTSGWADEVRLNLRP